MKKVLIIGYGTVGHNLAREIAALHPDVYDKYKPDENTIQDGERYDAAFVCVDTPYIPGECVCDTREVENAFLATKVSFCTQFWSTAREIGVDYEELRELFTLDPRVGKSHTFVYDDSPFWKSHCLDKDVPAIAETYEMPFLLSVIEFNERMKETV